MEYDRALYRVYERVMEELIVSSASANNNILNNNNTYEAINNNNNIVNRTTTRVEIDDTNLDGEAEENSGDNNDNNNNNDNIIVNNNNTSNDNNVNYNDVLFYFPFITIQLKLYSIIAKMSNILQSRNRNHNTDYEEVNINEQQQQQQRNNNSSSGNVNSSNSNPLYNYHAERIRNRMNINRQSFLIRNNGPPSQQRSSSITDNDNNTADNDEDEEATSEVQNVEYSSNASESDDEDDNNNNTEDNESDEEEMNRTITNTVERIREIRERMSTQRQTLQEENELLLQNNNNNYMCTQIGCWKVFQLCFLLSAWHIFVIISLHKTYITDTYYRTLQRGSATNHHVDSCIEYALRTRSPRHRTLSSLSLLDTNLTSNNTTTTYVENKTTTKELPLLGNDEILQINILYGGKCIGQCSRVHTIIPPSPSNTTNTTKQIIPTTSNTNINNNTWIYNTKINSSQFKTIEYWNDDVQYRFSSSEALLYVENDILHHYNISLVNITLTERCLSTGSDHGTYKSIWNIFAQFLSPIYDMDTPIVNLLCLGLSSSSLSSKPSSSSSNNDNDNNGIYGYLQNVHTSQHWSWKHKTSSSSKNKELSFIIKCTSFFFHKLSSLLLSTLTFFLITSITSLVVRVLTSSGVVLMYPLFATFQYFNISNNSIADERILSLSYPWIGRARTAIRDNNIHPSSHFLYAHTCKILLFYIMYEACQAAWSMVLYGRNVSESIPIWIYGIVMIWEYFTMVFVRSATSVYFFPRYLFMLFLGYHFYFYGCVISPYPYANIALIPLFLLSIMGMIYVLLLCEIPTFRRGSVSFECPREVFTRISWPDWTASLPQDFTLFLPLNSRYRSLYDVNVFPQQQQEGQREEEEQDNQESTTEQDSSNVQQEQNSNLDQSLSSSSSTTSSNVITEHSNNNDSTTTTVVPSNNNANDSDNALDELFSNWDDDNAVFDNSVNVTTTTTTNAHGVHPFVGIV